MNTITSDLQNGDTSSSVKAEASSAISIKTLGPTIHVHWADDPERTTRLGGLVHFVQFLHSTGLFDQFVQRCPLRYDSNNALKKLDVLTTIVLSILCGHFRYAHISAIRSELLSARLFGASCLPSEDSIRRAIAECLRSTRGRSGYSTVSIKSALR